MQQYLYDILYGGFFGDKQALVLGLVHEDTVVDSHQAALLHLQRKLAFSPGVAQGQLRGPGVLVKHKGAADRTSALVDDNIHGKVEQFGVAVLHLKLGKKLPDDFAGTGVLRHAQRLVLDVGSQTGGKYLDGNSAGCG